MLHLINYVKRNIKVLWVFQTHYLEIIPWLVPFLWKFMFIFREGNAMDGMEDWQVRNYSIYTWEIDENIPRCGYDTFANICCKIFRHKYYTGELQVDAKRGGIRIREASLCEIISLR